MEDHDDKDHAVQMPTPNRSAEPYLDLGHNTAIGRRLKAIYNDVASEPVPDRFLMLLDELDAAESGPKTPNRE